MRNNDVLGRHRKKIWLKKIIFKEAVSLILRLTGLVYVMIDGTVKRNL